MGLGYGSGNDCVVASTLDLVRAARHGFLDSCHAHMVRYQ